MWKNLWASRKFRIVMFDAVLATILLTVSTFVPEEYIPVILGYVAILQIPVYALVNGIAVEDAAAKRSGVLGDRTPDK